ncbi:hypothetical protein Pcinc_004377 [Petrolisthes cinctipes]|uniref:Uncharacterized protein n=1 Tax=Petrolisthes cinctipes TaxID=88211 RepID=A0AAE1GFT6_PETCI|nr:hypothetical protein Pcinc_004377 [Petrolisthes cinctipes]
MSKQREEEDDIDTRLKDAGLYEDGMPLDMKREIVMAIEMSCQSAKQEEEDRKQQKHHEQQLLANSLNRSLAGCVEPHQELDARDVEDENMSSEEVIALPADKVSEPPSNSVTSNQRLGDSQIKHQQSSHSSTPIKTPERSQSASSNKKPSSGTSSQMQQRNLNETHSQIHQRSVSGTPSQINKRSLSTTPDLMSGHISGQSSSPSISQQKESMSAPNWDVDSDLFASDSSTNTQQWKSSRRRLQMDNEASTSYSLTDTRPRNADSQEITMASPKEATSSQKIMQMKVSARRPLRNESTGDDSPSSSCSPSPVNSQPLFSSCGSDGSWMAVQEEVSTLIMSSPVAGSKKSYPRTSMSSQKISSVQESTVTSSPQGKCRSQKATVEIVDDRDIRNDDDDEMDLISPTPEISQSYKRNSKLPDSQPSAVCLNPKALPGDKESQQASNIEEDMMLDKNLQGVNFSHGTNFNNAREEQEKSAVESLDVEEDSVPTRTLKQSKWTINVFCPDVNPCLPMKRGGVELLEDPNKAYMQHNKESQEECRQRILELINRQLCDILEYQNKNITRKLKWSAPITVDRRLKNTLDRPKQQNKRQGIYQLEQPRRAQRLALKAMGEEQSVDDFLPDLEPVDDDWIEVQSKRQTRRKNRQLGLSRNTSKQSKQVSEAVLESREERLSHKSAIQKAVGCDSDDDFEFFPSSSSGEKKLELEKVSDMQNKIQLSMSSSAVSSSVSSSVSRSKFDQKKLGILDADSQLIESEVLIMKKTVDKTNKSLQQQQPEKHRHRQLETSTKCQEKRVPRKTFMLPSSINDGSNKSSVIASIPESNEEADKELRLSPQPSTSSADSSDESKNKPCQPGINNWINKSQQPSSPRQTSAIKNSDPSYKSSSRIKDEVAVNNRMDDICIIEEDSRGGPSLAKYPRRETRGNRGNQQDPIRPPPVKLKKSVIKSTNAAARPVDASENSDQFSNPMSQPPSQSGTIHKSDSENLDMDEDEKMACPICQQLFSMQKIQIHASDCTGSVDSLPTVGEKAEKGVVQGRRRGCKRKNGHNTEERVVPASSVHEEIVAAGYVRCEVCKETYPEGDKIFEHTQSCQGMRDIENNIMSPASSRSQARVGGGIAGSSRQSGGSMITQGQTGGRQGLRVTEEVPSGSVFERLEGLDVLEYHIGDITEPLFRHPDTALVQIINCVAVRPHGLSEVLAKTYPYCDSYSLRKPIGVLNRAVLEDRPHLGTIKVCRPTRPHAPIVINIFSQFFMGKEFRKNVHAKRIVNKIHDDHLQMGLKEDNATNRIKWFQEGLAALSKGIPKEINVNRVVFPSCIGCGLAGGDWLNNYLPSIKYFAQQMVKLGVKVIIVRKHTQLSDSDIAKQGTIRQTKLHPKK